MHKTIGKSMSLLCFLALLSVPRVASAGEKVTSVLEGPGVTVCVADFQNLKPHPDLDYLENAIAETISSRLGGKGTCKVVERSRLKEVKKELNLRTTDLVDPRTVAEVGRILGATHMIVGSYQVQLFPERWTINVRLVEVETTSICGGDQFSGASQAEVERAVLLWLIPPEEPGTIVPDFSDPGEAYRKGLALMAEGKWANALRLLWARVDASPDDYVAHRVIEDCAAKGELARELIHRYRALHGKFPKSAVVQNYYGNALLTLDPKDLSGAAAEAYRSAMRLDPNFAPPISNLATIELNRGHAQTAVEGFQTYARKCPEDPYAWFNLGTAYLALCRSKEAGNGGVYQKEAENAYFRAKELDCTLPEVWRGLGELYELSRNWEDAVWAYEGSLEMDPHQEDLAQHLEEIKKKAKKGYEEVKARFRGPPEIYDRARVAAQYTEALRLQKEAQSTEDLRRQKALYAKAADFYDWALNQESDNALGWLIKAACCLKAGRSEEAKKALARAVEIRPDVRDLPIYEALAKQAP